MLAWFKKPWLITIVFAIVSISIIVTLISINQKNYSGVFNLQWLVQMCILPILFVGISYREPEERRRTKLVIRTVSFMLPVLALALFFTYKPAYGIQDAMHKVENSSPLENVQLNNSYHLIGFNPPAGAFVNAGYVFSAQQGDKTATIIFNPVSGEYHVTLK